MQYDSRFQREGAKNGGTLLVREPVQFPVTSGAVMNTADITETTQSFTVATQKHVALPNFTTLDQSMSVDDYHKRYTEPAMARLAAEIESDVLSNVYKDIYNISGVVDTTPDTLLSVRLGNVKLSKGLAPLDDRHFMTESSAMATIMNTLNTYFHKGSEIEKAFSEGYIGRAAGLTWWENEMMPTHTNGTRDDTTPVCNTSTGITSGTASIVTTGADGTWLKGDVFTIADVYAVNPETKQRYDYLQQWVVTADNTNDATDTISVSPTPYTSGAKQNIELVSAGSGKVIKAATAGSSGTAGGVTTQSLAYHRDAFAFVTADLYMDPSANMSKATMDGITIRYWRSNDITNDKFPARIDVIYGYKTLRPEWACRVRSDAV